MMFFAALKPLPGLARDFEQYVWARRRSYSFAHGLSRPWWPNLFPSTTYAPVSFCDFIDTISWNTQCAIAAVLNFDLWLSLLQLWKLTLGEDTLFIFTEAEINLPVLFLDFTAEYFRPIWLVPSGTFTSFCVFWVEKDPTVVYIADEAAMMLWRLPVLRLRSRSARIHSLPRTVVCRGQSGLIVLFDYHLRSLKSRKALSLAQ